ncbi:MAG: hypothetical protein Q8936_00595 [Bacillota bacterium]|nr:hypothetical protein [Bacillota bacterium]
MRSRSIDTIDKFKFIALASIIICLLISIMVNSKKAIMTEGILLSGVLLILIKPNKHPIRLIYAQIIYNSIVKFGISCLHLPSSANYITDILTFLILVEALIHLPSKKIKGYIWLPCFVILTLFLITITGFIVNSQSIALYFWGVRNNFRMYIFFLGCVVLLKKKDIDGIFKVLLLISIFNTLFVTVQYFKFGIEQDYLGGVFGTSKGVNAFENIFMCVICIVTIVQFLYKKITAVLMLAVVFSSVYIAALSELKMFFVELAIIVVCVVILNKTSKKTILLVLGCVLSIYVGTQCLYQIFPHSKNYFSVKNIIAANNTYSSATDLGRLTATKTVSNMFLNHNKLKYLFGLGMGSAETSQISIFNSKFFNEYGDTLHYTWLSSAFMLIENGWSGLIIYLVFFIVIFGLGFKIRNLNKQVMDYCIMTQIFAVLCCVIVFYNSSLRMEAGYYAYFMLSIPFALSNKEILKNDH